MVTTVLLLRHGETALNRSGALRGLIDVPLSEHGQRQARLPAARIAAEYHLSALWASTLQRARSTAEAVARVTGLGVQIDARFNDVDYSSWAGRTWEDLSPEEQVEFQRWQKHPELPLPGAEHPADVQRRALAGLATLGKAGNGCIAIAAHDAVLQLLLCGVLGIDLRSYRGIAQHTATLNELERTAAGWRVRLLNSAYHLDDA
ncbi:MAG: histidine phosphatase family protein [Candidatus Binatia bacterium]|jgi:broad specificity phosphatase PhoE